MILSAAERSSEGVASKTRLEQQSQPAFDVCIEMESLWQWRIHSDINAAVSAVLRNMGEVVLSEVRCFDEKSNLVQVSKRPFPDLAGWQ